MLRLTADEQIPLTKDYFAENFAIKLLPTKQICAENLTDTDILVVRSNIKVNEHLLKNTPVKYVASPVSGDNHLDKAWLQANNIHWITASGCNALSVRDWVFACIALLRTQHHLLLNASLKAAIIGVGHVGKLIQALLTALNFEIILCDPLRAKQEPDFHSTPLDKIQDVDLICLHPSLHTDAPFSSLHLIDKKFLQKQKPGAILLNASRGEVTHTEDLMQYGKHLHWCFDVWPNEPNVDKELINQCLLATPHIAGHAIQSKWRGTWMIYNSLAKFLNLPLRNAIFPVIKPTMALNSNIKTWEEVILELYPIQNDLLNFKQIIADTDQANIADHFHALRKAYPIRHEINYPVIHASGLNEDDAKLLTILGLQFR